MIELREENVTNYDKQKEGKGIFEEKMLTNVEDGI